MPANDEQPSPEREQTDESLRVEREKADDALGQKLSALDETADAVIARARDRADEVLASARVRSDRQARTSDAPASERTDRKRAREDEQLREERADADERVRAERAETSALLATERDETDKDLLSERSRSDAAVATRDEFLGIVSHDLRDMLSAVVGFAAVIAKAESQEDHKEQVVRYAEGIQRSGARMNRLIGDLTDVACIEAGVLAVTREVGDPAEVVTEAVDSFQVQAAANAISVRAEIVPPASLASFDPARILQVLTNMLGNAIKFTPQGGRVVVRLERIADDLRFAVSDTGVGIPEAKLATVFERFRQVERHDRRGVGLGLYISKCIVQGHGGRIWAESTPGEGSVFCFTLPVHHTSAARG